MQMLKQCNKNDNIKSSKLEYKKKNFFLCRRSILKRKDDYFMKIKIIRFKA